MKRRPIVLCVLDGWGHRPEREHNAIQQEAHGFQELLSRYPHALLSASGEEVGLPLGLMGNSEVGHTNLGAGRVVYQEITRIDQSIADGAFVNNAAFTQLMDKVRSGSGTLHFVGLIGEGGVHASNQHLRALLHMAASRGLDSERVAVHAILDGRDTPPRSGVEFVAELEKDVANAGVGRIASVVGRYWAMDRDERWERVQRAFDLFVSGRGEHASSALDAVRASYAAGVGDEFVEPHVVGAPDALRIADGDAVICFNFRSDRMRQICRAFYAEDFNGFEREPRVRPEIATMTQYHGEFPFAVAFPPRELKGLFGDIVSEHGLRQARMAETEKYAHVTFFFSGGREALLPGEDRVLVPSPKVATYDLQPQMSAPELTDRIVERLRRDETDVYVINFANADMVGHTGIEPAARAAVRAVDAALARIVPEVTSRGGVIAITADHGNAEQMWDPEIGQPHTAHTTNPVPIVFCGEDLIGARPRPMGILADVAPTLLGLAGLPLSEGMDGTPLLP